MCFFGFLRFGEVVSPSDSGFDPAYHLSVNDVWMDANDQPRLLQVLIKASRTDPLHERSAYLPRKNIQQYLPGGCHSELHGSERGDSDPFFMFTDGRCLTREHLVSAYALGSRL